MSAIYRDKKQVMSPGIVPKHDSLAKRTPLKNRQSGLQGLHRQNKPSLLQTGKQHKVYTLSGQKILSL